MLMTYKIGAASWAVNKMKEIAHDVISRLGPEDLAAVVWSQRSDDAQGLTDDQAKVHAAIDRMRQGLPWPNPDCIREYAVDVLEDCPEKRKLIINIPATSSKSR